MHGVFTLCRGFQGVHIGMGPGEGLGNVGLYVLGLETSVLLPSCHMVPQPAVPVRLGISRLLD
jgi:hypothetical protein